MTARSSRSRTQLYFIYSGWPLDNRNDSDLTQQLFIIRLRDPLTADSSPPTLLCKPEQSWERTARHGINEGPQYLASQDGRWKGIVYSCAASWTTEYKMNTLRYLGGDPLDIEAAWEKGSKPLLQTDPQRDGPRGPGHGSFLHVDGETVGILSCYRWTEGRDEQAQGENAAGRLWR